MLMQQAEGREMFTNWQRLVTVGRRLLNDPCYDGKWISAHKWRKYA